VTRWSGVTLTDMSEASQQDPGKYGPRFLEAWRRFDEENGRDPNLVVVGEVAQPQELLYAERLTDWVLRLNPEASEELLLAARSQHICRWTIPRHTYEMTRPGYLRWRSDLKQFHAAKSAEILREVGYDPETIAQVRELNLKKNLGRDPDCQTLEDALCLVTLQYQLADLVAKTERGKMIEILRKTWKKMSPLGHEHALTLSFSEREKGLIQEAVGPEGSKRI
jgi:Domain of unknown function (DUF4202)